VTEPNARHRARRTPARPTGRRVAQRPRPRYGRIAAFVGAFAATAVAVAAGVGVIPTDSAQPAYAADRGTDEMSLAEASGQGVAAQARATGVLSVDAREAGSTDLPTESGTGRRVVFDQSDQRVWLVRRSGEVARTYLVSGSVSDNLQPGTYSVYSRSRWAVGIDDSGVMEYFVRFAQGDNAAIGFHSIPSKNGQPLQTKRLLGTPQSHGCIRQDLPDALALWEFAPEGTRVVVTP
jgi:hypothetical protein